jgi:hypothetical protein
MSAIWDARKCGAIVIFKEKESYDVGLCTWTLLGPEIDLELMYTHLSESRTVRFNCFVIGDTVAGHKMFTYSARANGKGKWPQNRLWLELSRVRQIK